MRTALQRLVANIDKGSLKLVFSASTSHIWQECSRKVIEKTGWKNLMGSADSIVPIIGPIIAEVVAQNLDTLNQAKEFNKTVTEAERWSEVRRFFMKQKG